jgi:hypothetical protein
MRQKMGHKRTLYRQGGTCLIRNEKNVLPDQQFPVAPNAF